MSHRLEIGLVALLGLALGVALWAGGRDAVPGADMDTRASTLATGPAGSSAPYAVLARLGVRVERRRTPLTDLARTARPRPALLVVLDPRYPLQPSELVQVARFVRGGGAVLAAARGGGITRCAGWATGAPSSALLGDTIPVRPLRSGLSLPPVGDVLRPGAASESSTDECRRLEPAGVDTLLAARDGRPVVVSLTYPGGGAVTLLSDASYFRNRAWRAGHAPYFVVPLLVGKRPGAIVWDEYHQGFSESVSLAGATWAWLIGTPAGWAILQIVGVVIVVLAVAAVRFGPARSVVERRRRSPLEHLEALAAGLEGAGGVDTAVRLTVAGLRRRLIPGGRGIAGGEGQWLAALALGVATPRGREAVRRLERSIDPSNEPGGTERLLVASQAVEDVWEELRPRMTRDAS
jgi:hypothetical protein